MDNSLSSNLNEYKGQAEQDKFVLKVLKGKTNGYFLEIGSNDPININNTYVLEKEYNWKGIMVEYEKSFLPLYKKHRPNSIHLINDATKIDYKHVLENNNIPLNIDYLQIDLDANNGSTLKTLELLDETIFDNYKFATITFEHDVYSNNVISNNNNNIYCRLFSREIFKKRGYLCVFEDIHNELPQFVYEDWYVHPDLVDMEYINKLILLNKDKYIFNKFTKKSINWQDIIYPEF